MICFKRRHAIIAAFCCIFMATALFDRAGAQETTTPGNKRNANRATLAPAPEQSQQLVSIDFNNVDIGVFIKFISDLTKRNFVIDDRVKGKVSIISPGKITVAEAYKVFESVLEVNGFAAVPAGEIIKIVSAPDARTKNIKTRLEAEAVAPDDSVVTQIIPMHYANPVEIKRLFTPLVSKNSVILSYEPTNTLIITDVQSNINRLLRILRAIDITGVGQQLAIIPVEYADATKLVNLLNSIFKSNRRGRKAPADNGVTFVADERTNVIVMLASEAETESIRELVKSLDKETPKGQAKIHVYYLENASAEELVKVLQNIPEKTAGGKPEAGKPTAPLVSGDVRITADKATNSLIIMADQEDYVTLEDIIRQVDIPRAMVYIEALIMEVDVNKDFSLGVEWLAGSETSYDNKDMIYGGGFTPNDDTPYGTTAGIIASPTGVSTPPAGFSMGIFGESIAIGDIVFPTISALVQAYKKDRDVNILSTPQILTTDNQEAKIYVGKNVPFQTQAGVASTTASQAYNSYEYRDVGKTLKITPQISKDRMVRLVISLESTALESTTDNRPTTLKRTVETTAIVKDRHTIVLGGLIDESTGTTDRKVPCLGDIPGLGLLFRSIAKGNSKTNLYIFLKPRVIQNPSEADEVADTKKTNIESLSEKKIKLFNDRPLLEETRLPVEDAPRQPESDEELNNSTVKPTSSFKRPLNHETLGSESNPESDSGTAQTSVATDQSQQPAENTSPAVLEDNKQTKTSPPAEQYQNSKNKPDAAVSPKQPQDLSKSTVLAAPASTTGSASVAPGKGYTIQVASIQSAQKADLLLKELVAQGYAAYTVRTEINAKIWYQLRIGYYKQRDVAQEVMRRLRANHYNPMLVKL